MARSHQGRQQVSANPITSTLARLIAAQGSPVQSVTLAAPAIHGDTIIAVTWAEFTDEPVEVAERGVTMTIRSRLPTAAATLPPSPRIEQLALETAWSYGAWDVLRTYVAPGYTGPLPPYMAGFEAAARDQGYIEWSWRPMMAGPELRAKTWAAHDRTLCPYTLGRSGSLPDLALRVAQPASQLVIRLGTQAATSSTAPDRAGRPARGRRWSNWTYTATQAQRQKLLYLMDQTGQREEIPDNLTRAEAARWIDRLMSGGTLSSLTGPAPATPEQRGYLGRLLRKAGLSDALPDDLTKSEASRWIDQLKGKS